MTAPPAATYVSVPANLTLVVSGSDVGLSVIRADRVGLTIPGLHIEPCRFLVLVIVGEGSSRRRDRSA